MREMIARVARAIEWSRTSFYERGGKGCGPIAEFQARAAIEAMREPTDEMTTAGARQPITGPIDAIWRAMIDAALAEK